MFRRRKQPVCPKCGSGQVSMKIRYKDVEAVVPVRNGRIKYEKMTYSGPAERCLVCELCGEEFSQGLTGESFV